MLRVHFLFFFPCWGFTAVARINLIYCHILGQKYIIQRTSDLAQNQVLSLIKGHNKNSPHATQVHFKRKTVLNIATHWFAVSSLFQREVHRFDLQTWVLDAWNLHATPVTMWVPCWSLAPSHNPNSTFYGGGSGSVALQ